MNLKSALLSLLLPVLLHGQGAYKNAPVVSGIIFRVQILSSRTPLPAGYFKSLPEVMEDQAASGTYLYSVGTFQYYESAVALKSELAETGYKEAMVLAFQNGRRIPLDDAIRIVDLSFTEPALMPEPVPTPPDTVPPPVVQADTAKLEFTVQVSARQAPVPEGHPEFAEVPELYHTLEADHLYHYYSGRFSSVGDARDRRILLKEAGFENSFMVAFLEGKRIPLEEAVRIMLERKKGNQVEAR